MYPYFDTEFKITLITVSLKLTFVLISVTKYPSLPESARINDAFLSTLVQMIQVEYVPSSFFIIPAHRACLGPARAEDGSELVS